MRFLSCPTVSSTCLIVYRKYKKPEFATKLLETLQHVHAPAYSTKEQLDPTALTIFKVSGSLTNAVFFVSYPSKPTVLLRIYGSSSGSLISRPRELHILHILSSKYRIGPRVYGTFENGRVEEYFESTTLNKDDMRDAEISRWIAYRMAELHSVDLSSLSDNMESEEIAAINNVESWLQPASQVLALPSISPSTLEKLDLETIQKDWDAYVLFLDAHGQGKADRKKVFAHNDAQYGNLLRVKNVKKGSPDHHQIIVVDFEYASPNPPAFDIANHFHEWTASYSDPDHPHILNPSRYPTPEERRNFYRAYLKQSAYLSTGTAEDPTETELAQLEEHVRLWSPAVHAMWTIWGIVQAREDVEAAVEKPEFDNIGYSVCRAGLFREELRALGLNL